MPEAWLRGPVEGVDPWLMPVAHALAQAREDVARVAAGLTPEELAVRPGGAASAAFHLRHLAGSLDRLFTYARGEALSAQQREALAAESADAVADAGALLAEVDAAIGRALDQLRRTRADDLLTPREVGRARLPSTVLGLLFHAAEHTTRHVGQLITTVKVVRGAAG